MTPKKAPTTNTKRPRRSQADRREETVSKLLLAARRLFGERGYGETSLEEIAEACDMTIRPVYHYFESKLGLFAAMVEQMEGEMLASAEDVANATPTDIWTSFVQRCEDPHFRQIMLIDAPNLLGHRRTTEGAMTRSARYRTAKLLGKNPDGLAMNMLMGALSQAALYIGERGASAEDYGTIRELIDFYSEG